MKHWLSLFPESEETSPLSPPVLERATPRAAQQELFICSSVCTLTKKTHQKARYSKTLKMLISRIRGKGMLMLFIAGLPGRGPGYKDLQRST